MYHLICLYIYMYTYANPGRTDSFAFRFHDSTRRIYLYSYLYDTHLYVHMCLSLRTNRRVWMCVCAQNARAQRSARLHARVDKVWRRGVCLLCVCLFVVVDFSRLLARDVDMCVYVFAFCVSAYVRIFLRARVFLGFSVCVCLSFASRQYSVASQGHGVVRIYTLVSRPKTNRIPRSSSSMLSGYNTPCDACKFVSPSNSALPLHHSSSINMPCHSRSECLCIWSGRHARLRPDYVCASTASKRLAFGYRLRGYYYCAREC